MFDYLNSQSIAHLATSVVAGGRSANTAKSYTADLRALLDYYGTTNISHEGLDDLARKWLNNAGAPSSTTRRRAASLRAYAKMTGVSLLVDYRLPPEPRHDAHPLPNQLDDVKALLDAADSHREQLLIALCAGLGLRVGEALTVTPSSVDWPNDTVRITGKGRKEREVPITGLARPYLERAVDRANDPHELLLDRSDSWARQTVRKLGKAANLARPIASHDLRSTFATVAYDTTKDLTAVQDLLGHASPVTTRRYTLARMASKRAATAAIA